MHLRAVLSDLRTSGAQTMAGVSYPAGSRHARPLSCRTRSPKPEPWNPCCTVKNRLGFLAISRPFYVGPSWVRVVYSDPLPKSITDPERNYTETRGLQGIKECSLHILLYLLEEDNRQTSSSPTPKSKPRFPTSAASKPLNSKL